MLLWLFNKYKGRDIIAASEWRLEKGICLILQNVVILSSQLIAIYLKRHTVIL